MSSIQELNGVSYLLQTVENANLPTNVSLSTEKLLSTPNNHFSVQTKLDVEQFEAQFDFYSSSKHGYAVA